MTAAAAFRSGKSARDENFPVASWLIKSRHRPVILAFYHFVRTADDIADHAFLGVGEKLEGLDRLEASLLGNGNEPEGQALRIALAQHDLSPSHAQDLLRAFRQDVVKRRYANWDELMDYCALSAMPVGRFVLDVHGESQTTWPASDALCAALQIINHVQDCGADYRNLDRVYIPLDMLSDRGGDVASLGEARANATLRKCLRAVVARTESLLEQSRGLAGSVNDTRLAMEVSSIQALAERLVHILLVRDPLSEPVHLSKGTTLAVTANGAVRTLLRRRFRGTGPSRRYQTP